MSRMEFGQLHERLIADALVERGWTVEPFGQGMMTDQARAMLLGNLTMCYWRWLPDFIVGMSDRVVLVDAKSTRGGWDNHSVEIAALMAHQAMASLGLPIYYVWDDLTCGTPNTVAAHRLRSVMEPATDGNGSDTPFTLIRRERFAHIDRVFGAPIPGLQAA